MNPILRLGILAALKLAYDAWRVYEDTATWAIPDFIAERVASFLNGCKARNDATESIAIAANARGAKLQSHRLQYYQEEKSLSLE